MCVKISKFLCALNPSLELCVQTLLSSRWSGFLNSLFLREKPHSGLWNNKLAANETCLGVAVQECNKLVRASTDLYEKSLVEH